MSIAKTVSHSPLRPNLEKASFRNALDNPLKAKWPILSETAAQQIRKLLDSSLSGLKVVFSKPRTISKNRGSKRKRRTSNSQSAKCREDARDSAEPLAKRLCVTKDNRTEYEGPSVEKQKQEQVPLSEPSLSLEESSGEGITSSNVSSNPQEVKDSNIAATEKGEGVVIVSGEAETKRWQLVVGVNAVTRQLEQGRLEVGLVCSTSPGMLYQHILPLAATREVPFAALPDLSKILARLLGIKRAMCIGWKKVGDCTNQFSELTDTIVSLAPPISLPWLAPKGSGTPVTSHRHEKSEKLELSDHGASEVKGIAPSKCSPLLTRHVAEKEMEGGMVYTPLQVKKTKFVPNSKKDWRRKGKQ